jgi:hypothetical protein
MIDVKELLYDIDLKLNKIGSNEHQNIELENKIIALNDAQINLIKTKFSGNNTFKIGLDGFQKRYNDLETLIVKDKFLDLKDDVTPLKSWSCDLEKLDPTYMLGIPGTEYFLANKGSCKDHIMEVLQIKHGDINRALGNSNTKPSFEWQQAPGTISSHRWQIYTDGSFTPTKFYLWYVRYPVPVDFEGYSHLDGTASQTVNCELPYFLKEEIVDIAVRNLALFTENQSAAQTAQLKIQNNE